MSKSRHVGLQWTGSTLLPGLLLQSVGVSCGGGEWLAKSTPPLAAVGLLFEAEGKKKEQTCIYVIT